MAIINSKSVLFYLALFLFSVGVIYGQDEFDVEDGSGMESVPVQKKWSKVGDYSLPSGSLVSQLPEFVNNFENKDDALNEGLEFARRFSELDDVHTLDDGLMYRALIGDGSARPADESMVAYYSVHYTGYLVDGTVFDSSLARGTPLQAEPERTILGWRPILQSMKEGDTWEVLIPTTLAYGNRAVGSIPANSALLFQIELLAVDRDITLMGLASRYLRMRVPVIPFHFEVWQVLLFAAYSMLRMYVKKYMSSPASANAPSNASNDKKKK